MSPLEIRIMLHHFYSPEAWPRQSPASDEAIERFVGLGLLEAKQSGSPSEALHHITEKGVAYVNALCRVSLPEAHYVCRLEGEE